MAQWIKTSVRFDKVMDNGRIKEVKEHYLVDALSFTEAEERIVEEMTPYISGDFDVAAVKKSRITEVFRDNTGDKWYLVKVAFVSFNEKTETSKRTISTMIVQASNFDDAVCNFKKGMADTVADYEIVSVAESPIMNVFEA